MLRACNEGRQVAASADAWHTQYDLSAMLGELRDGAGTHPDFNLYSECAAFYRELGLPELMHSDFAAGDLDGLSKQAGLLDRRIRQWLGEQSVDLSEFETLEEFERSL